MKTIRGPAIFLAQFMGDKPPFNTIETAAKWAKEIGYVGVQIPTWDARAIDLAQAAKSRAWCDDYKGRLAELGVEVTELSTHLQGQLVAVHPAYDELFDAFAAPEVRGKPAARQKWAVEQVKLALRASRNLGCSAMPTFSGALLWPFFHPWPQRPPGLVEEGFAELARRWAPILKTAEECGVDCAFEIHPGEDLHDGVTFERFLAATGDHPRARILYDPSHFVLQGLDYLDYIDIYHPFIRAFHVKDAEFIRSGRSGAFGGFQDWKDRPGRYRSPGDGQIDWTGIFTRLARHGYAGWAVVEWECAFKDSEVGAREGAELLRRQIIRVTERAFDDFASVQTDRAKNRRVLGIS
ncbi:MAG: sugar phosphate isomerase/epimerase [Planctomycetes bacterium]|nr:sugar phosphate isomerase/epimerase [Planctomycetota bacterium]